MRGLLLFFVFVYKVEVGLENGFFDWVVIFENREGFLGVLFLDRVCYLFLDRYVLTSRFV